MAPFFSPDGKSVLTGDLRTHQLVLLPTGAGDPVTVTRDGLQHFYGRFLPDGKRIVFAAGKPGGGHRSYVQALSGGTPEPISPEGVEPGPVSPDGRFVAAVASDSGLHLYPTSPGDSPPPSAFAAGDYPV